MTMMTMTMTMVVDSIIDENKFEETSVAVVHADTDTDDFVFAIMGVVVALLVVADNNGLLQPKSKSVSTATQPAAVSTTIGHSFSNHFF